MMKYSKLFTYALGIVLVLPMTVSADTASCVTFTRNLSFGATGAEVTKLQTFLKSQGYFSATMVPRYGPATLASVRAFQKAKGISNTGTVGPLTRAAIKSISCASVGTPATTSIFEVTGWIPYWRTATGTADVLPHLDALTEVNPFVYTLKSDGTLLDSGAIDQEPWISFIATAKQKQVRVIPTAMTSNSSLVHQILSNTQSRTALVTHIGNLVREKNFDGIDIDFEGKKADTKEYFSLFLKELKTNLGSDKWLMCTIETRIPFEDRYFGTDIPADAGIFANDLVEINKYCDRVRIMTYDQQRIDQKINAQYDTSGVLYAPVGDPAWIEKVVNHMAKDIDRSKMLIGVPTYGYEYAVTVYANNEYVYDILWTFNPGYAYPIAQQYGITPARTPWGEMAFTYTPLTGATTTAPVSANTHALATATAAAGFATAYNSNLTFRYMVWPDAQSIQTRIDLAKKLGVRGISVFKFDGGQDPNIWATLTGVKK